MVIPVVFGTCDKLYLIRFDLKLNLTWDFGYWCSVGCSYRLWPPSSHLLSCILCAWLEAYEWWNSPLVTAVKPGGIFSRFTFNGDNNTLAVYFGLIGIRPKPNNYGELDQMSLEVLAECFKLLQWHLPYLTVSGKK